MKKLLIGILMLSAGQLAFGQFDRSIVPQPAPAPEIHIPTPTVFDLENGIKVILSTDRKIPKVAVNLVMGSDSRLEGNKAGLSDLMGSLLLSGTQTRTKDQLDEEKDLIGADFSANSNSLYLSVLTKHLDKGMEIFTDVMKNASFPESEFDRIKKQYESGLYSAMTDPNSMMENAISKTIFGNEHPFGEVMTEQTLANISREDVINLYKQQYTPAGSYLIIVGDINEAGARELAQKYFGDWDGVPPFEQQYGKGIRPEGNQVIFVEKPGAVQSVISIAFPIDAMPGDEDNIKLSVLNKVLGGGGFGTRLMQNLREDKAYTYGAYSSLDIDREGSLISASGNFRNDVTDSAIVQFLYEFSRITESLVKDEEIDLNKASMFGSFARSLESSRTVARFALNTFRNNLPADYYQTYLQKLESVNKDDLLNMAQKHFTPNNLYIVVVGNKEVLEKIKQFDSDGEITILDAFGNPAKEVEYKETNIAKEDVLKGYLMAVTQTNNWESASKKVLNIKTMSTYGEVEMQQMPVKFDMTQHFQYPNSNSSKIEFKAMGIVLQEEVFNGVAGFSKNINEEQKMDTKVYSSEDITAKRKTSAVFPEFGLLCNLDDLDILGIENKNGKDFYVISYKIGKSTVTEYYNTENFLKTYSSRLQEDEEGSMSVSSIYSDYQEIDGYLFPMNTTQMMESMGMELKIKSIDINKKIDSSIFNID